MRQPCVYILTNRGNQLFYIGVTSDIAARMDAIRMLAAEHGLAALEGLADWSAHHAMMPGCRAATASSLEHMATALESDSPADRQTILAALALRLH